MPLSDLPFRGDGARLSSQQDEAADGDGSLKRKTCHLKAEMSELASVWERQSDTPGQEVLVAPKTDSQISRVNGNSSKGRHADRSGADGGEGRFVRCCCFI